MKPLWLLIWAAAVGQITIWTFVPAAPPRTVEPRQDVAFGTNEELHVQSRVDMRKYAFSALDLPWGSRCSGETKKAFISGLNEYYYHRQNQIERYPENFGQAGADYIAKQWSTTDDRRIDRLAQEAYAKGYLNPADFNPVARKSINVVIKDERIIGKACEG